MLKTLVHPFFCIESLDLSRMGLTQKNFYVFDEGLAAMKSLKHLTLDDNLNLNCPGVAGILKSIRGNCKLVSFSAKNCGNNIFFILF